MTSVLGVTHTEAERKMVIQQYKNSFNNLMSSSTIQNPQRNMLMVMPEAKGDYQDELNLFNPYSKITSFILYMYSIEFGDPPLYAVLNSLSRNRRINDSTERFGLDSDKTLKQLGPFAKALLEITHGAEANRDIDDKIMTGR